MERTNGWITALQIAVADIQGPSVADESTPAASGVKASEPEGLADWRETLTNREYEILLLLEQRKSDKEISDQLCISLETVKTHTKNIRSKLDANSRRDAVSRAIALKIL